MGMAQVMEANARQRAIAGKEAHPLLPETVWTQRRSFGLDDHEVVVRQALPEPQKLFRLP